MFVSSVFLLFLLFVFFKFFFFFSSVFFFFLFPAVQKQSGFAESVQLEGKACARCVASCIFLFLLFFSYFSYFFFFFLIFPSFLLFFLCFLSDFRRFVSFFTKRTTIFINFHQFFHQFSAIFHDFQRFSSISSIFTDFCRFVTKVPTSVPIVCRIHSLNFDKRAPTYCLGEKCPEQCANFGAPNLACRRGPFCAPDSHFPPGSVPILAEKSKFYTRAIHR